MASRYDDDYEFEQAPRRKRPAGGEKRSSGSRGGAGRPAVRRNSQRGGYGREYDSEYDDVRRAPTKKGKSSGKKLSKKAQAKKKRRRIILFLVEITVLVLLLLFLFKFVQPAEKVNKLEIPEDEIIVNEEVQQEETLKGYRNVALFGVDSRSGALQKETRSDSIMVASINQDTKEVKLVSVFRDTFLNIGNDTYNKCNSAYAKGGPKQAMNMLNQNLDLDIKDFVTVGFEGLADVVNALGGVSINIEKDEITHLNNYQKCIAEDLKRSYTPVTNTGTQVLDGLQATGYCRIRYTSGDDFRRAERQRTVLKEISEKAKQASVSQLSDIANDTFDKVYTSFDLGEIVELLGDAASYKVVADEGFPQEEYRKTGTIGQKGSCVIPTDLATSVKLLHQFLFNDPAYTPSNEVEEYSKKIQAETSQYVH